MEKVHKTPDTESLVSELDSLTRMVVENSQACNSQIAKNYESALSYLVYAGNFSDKNDFNTLMRGTLAENINGKNYELICLRRSLGLNAIASSAMAQYGQAMNNIERLPLYIDKSAGPDSYRHETDGEHSVMVALMVDLLSDKLYPEYDRSKLLAFSLVHDLVEIKAGDTPTFDMGPNDLCEKEEIEALASQALKAELPPEIAETLEIYEEQIVPESRFVRAVDKLAPSLVDAQDDSARHIMDDVLNIDIDDFARAIAKSQTRFDHLFPEYPEIKEILVQFQRYTLNKLERETYNAVEGAPALFLRNTHANTST